MACGNLVIHVSDTPAPTSATVKLNGCAAIFSDPLPQMGPYPNNFNGTRIGKTGYDHFFFNHKAWEYVCYTNGDGSEGIKCGGRHSGWTAYSDSSTQDFTALTSGGSTTIDLNIQVPAPTYQVQTAQVTLTCSGM